MTCLREGPEVVDFILQDEAVCLTVCMTSISLSRGRNMRSMTELFKFFQNAQFHSHFLGALY